MAPPDKGGTVDLFAVDASNVSSTRDAGER